MILYINMDVNKPSAITNDLIRVRDINWADPNISRAGIIPIYNDGVYKWIGLGITNYATYISAIGGSYESKDVDLLATAVREYNEEVGTNMQPIIDESVYNYYAIKTNYTIQILLPITRRPENFIKTEELYDLLWVTPQQLRSMDKYQTYILPGPRYEARPTLAFAFGYNLKDLILILAKVVESESPFTPIISTEPFIRPLRISEVIIPKITNNLGDLEKDSKNFSKFFEYCYSDFSEHGWINAW